ncbi:class I SAM-dependent methyltransferase [Mycobacterium sp. NBC_00419]|uniref:THUMP-like domain-containing protein n=1 Tax=Mycobacterium sp. NBC_00419 TaxID=2975989 RepID=UPI002E1B30D2
MVLQRDDHWGQTVLTFGLDDVAYLASDAGTAALAEVAGYPLTDRVADVAAIRQRFGERTTVLIETTLLRRKAAVKLAGLADVAGWLFTDEALQQATAAPVAQHRAARLAGAAVHDATCSVGTELAALRATASFVLGSDLDPVRLAMAHHNVPDVPLCRADAVRPVSRDTVVLVDPARRSGGRRRFDPRAYSPPLDAVIAAYQGRATVVKCAPGIDFSAVRELGFDGEIEVTSAGGSVREACLWSAPLAQPGVRRRATVLDRAEQVTDADPDDCPAGPPGRWIVDPDGAVVRAGLVRQYATRHGLWQLDPDIAYLTGDQLPQGVRGFEVIDEVPLREKILRQALSRHDCGPLEILVRGVDVDPDALRRRLRPSGSAPLSLVITRIGAGPSERTVVYLCRASAGAA